MKSDQNDKNGLAEDIAVYILGGMDAKEREEFLNTVQGTTMQEQLTEAQETLEILAQHQAIAPPAHIRNRLFSQLFGKTFSSSLRNIQSKIQRLYYYVAAASLLAVIGLGSAMIMYNSRENLRITLQETQSILQKEKNNNIILAQKSMLLDQRDALVFNRDIVVVALREVQQQNKQLRSTIYWNKKDNTVFFESGTLTALGNDKSYQLWALKDGVPIDLGIFDVTTQPRIMTMKSAVSPDAFAVTIEPRGGSKLPTLQTLTVLGKVTEQTNS